MNEILSILNHLYWFKDSLDLENQVDYLKTLRRMAEKYNLVGFIKEVDDYLKILTKNE